MKWLNKKKKGKQWQKESWNSVKIERTNEPTEKEKHGRNDWIKKEKETSVKNVFIHWKYKKRNEIPETEKNEMNEQEKREGRS